jgi:AcrR family transcriptional regulator
MTSGAPSQTPVTGDAAPGLRERKRRRTRDAIARAALELFDRQGFRATTLPQIATAADVSPRTVSGHFATKESLAFPRADEELEALAARLTRRPAGETTTEALRDWIERWLHEAAGREEELALQRRVIAANEELRAHQHEVLRRAHRPIAEAFARDLGQDPADLEPRMAAAATLTVFELLGDDWKRAPGRDLRAELGGVDLIVRFIDGGTAALRREP